MTENNLITNISVFIPRKFFNHHSITNKTSCVLYGKCIQHDNAIKFFIITEKEHQDLELIATINEDFHNKDAKNIVRLCKEPDDGIEEIGLKVKEIVVNHVRMETMEIRSIYLILYDGLENIDSKFKTGTLNTDQRYDVLYLATLMDMIKSNSETLFKECSMRLRQLFRFYFISLYNFISYMLLPLKPLFKQTAVYRHFHDWITCVKNYGFDNGKAWTLIFDMSTGILILGLLLNLGNPGEYLMCITKLVVNNLKSLLSALKGSPVGLKLNVLLNEFFLDCFLYHVDLWFTFLIIMAPAIQYLSVPLAALGFLGVSFQLAMLSDILTVISLHAHCFYIYAAVLYRIEVIGIKALWRVVLGRRKNVLRNRVESHEYMSRQLFLATMFFAALLFLSPTVLVYYIVFASVSFFYKF